MRPLPLALIIASLADVGCRRFSDDSADVCFTDTFNGDEDPVFVDAGDPIRLFVTGFGGCHMKDLEVTCDIELDGDTLVVETQTTWIRTEWFAVGCESILLTTETTCDTPALDTGSYTLAYADDERAIEVPGEVEGCLPGF